MRLGILDETKRYLYADLATGYKQKLVMWIRCVDRKLLGLKVIN